MPEYPTALELTALRHITYEYEDRCKLGGEKTFASILANGWIAPFEGYNPNGDKYSITSAGRAARDLGKAPKQPKGRPLNRIPDRFPTLAPRLKSINE